MRIISFAKMWDKLKKPIFTTFRVPRKDSYKGKDWHINEVVQVYYHSRQPDREKLGEARIIDKTSKWLSEVTDLEAIEDGFEQGLSEMYEWLCKAHNTKVNPSSFRINKLTLEWV